MKKYEIKQLENDCWELKFEDKDYYKVVAKLTHNHILQYNALSNSDKTNFEDSIPYGLTSFDKAVNTFNGKTKYTYYEETLPLGVEMFQKTCETYNNKKHKTKFST